MDDLELRIEELMADSGLSRAEAREQALREEAERAYQTSQAPAPRRINPQDLMLARSAPSEPRPSSRPPASASASSSADAADACRCSGAGWYVADAPYGHPDFGRLVACSCTARERSARAAVAASALLAQLHAELGRLRHCTLATFSTARPVDRAIDVAGVVWGEPAQRETLLEGLAAAELYAEDPAGWLYIHGPVGSGKSHLAAAVCNHLAARGRTVAYATAAGLMTFLKAGFADSSADRRLLALQRVELLAIDDLGTERRALAGEWAYEQFYELLNARYLHERPTVLTSNLPPSHLEERLRDRVRGMAVQIHLVASSYRQLRRQA